MVVQELYKHFLLLINKNDSNEGVTFLPSQFVLLFNAETLRWLAEELKKDEDNIDVNLIELLLVTDLSLGEPVNKQKQFLEFQMPTDFFQTYGSYSLANQGECKDVRISNYEKKPGNLIPVLSDESTKPSFEYEEAPFIVGSDKLKLYIGDDYTITDTFINYYRVPKKIDMEGYINFAGEESQNVDPELDDYSNLKILSRLAKEIMRETENPEGFQFANERTNTEF